MCVLLTFQNHKHKQSINRLPGTHFDYFCCFITMTDLILMNWLFTNWIIAASKVTWRDSTIVSKLYSGIQPLSRTKCYILRIYVKQKLSFFVYFFSTACSKSYQINSPNMNGFCLRSNYTQWLFRFFRIKCYVSFASAIEVHTSTSLFTTIETRCLVKKRLYSNVWSREQFTHKCQIDDIAIRQRNILQTMQRRKI